MTTQEGATESFGANAWLVDEMYERYLDDPTSVAESWRDFFADYNRDGGDRSRVQTTAEPRPDAGPSQPSAPPAAAPAQEQVPASASPIRGAAARIVANMEASLAVPTATSVRDVPARLLEVQRSIINGHLGRTRGGKVSFTHLIAFAVLKALEAVPAMKNTYAEDEGGRPYVVRN